MNFFVNNIFHSIRFTFDYKGRSSRQEFWNWMLFGILLIFINLRIEIAYTPYSAVPIDLLIFLPTLSISVRRLRDVGKKFWWLLLYFSGPISLYLLWLLTRPSVEAEANNSG